MTTLPCGRWSKIGTFWLVVAQISDICWARVGVKVGLEYVYLKYPLQTFYVNDKLNVLEHTSGLDFCFMAFSLSVFATTPAGFF